VNRSREFIPAPLESPSIRINISLKPHELQAIDAAARSIGLKRSAFVVKGALILAGQPHLVDAAGGRAERRAFKREIQKLERSIQKIKAKVK
jgi:hypothetical protein